MKMAYKMGNRQDIIIMEIYNMKFNMKMEKKMGNRYGII